MRYQDLIALFDPAYGKASFEEKAAKDDFIDLMNERGLGALRYLLYEVFIEIIFIEASVIENTF